MKPNISVPTQREALVKKTDKQLSSFRSNLSGDAGFMAHKISQDRLFSVLSSSIIPAEVNLGAFSTHGTRTISGDSDTMTSMSGERINPKVVPYERTDGAYLKHLDSLFFGGMDHKDSQAAYDKEVAIIVDNLQRIRTKVTDRLKEVAEKLGEDGKPVLDFLSTASDQNVGDMSIADFGKFHEQVIAKIDRLDKVGVAITDTLGKLVGREPQAQKKPILAEISVLMRLLAHIDGIIKKCVTYQDKVAALQEIGKGTASYDSIAEAMAVM